jgi:hypothetical protein
VVVLLWYGSPQLERGWYVISMIAKGWLQAMQAEKRIATARKVMDAVQDLFCFHVKLGACMTWPR